MFQRIYAPKEERPEELLATIMRWDARRKDAIAEGDLALTKDCIMVIFIYCFCMRDWLLASYPEKEARIREYYRRPQLALCRDIANGSKHLEINQPSVDSDYMLAREWCPIDGSNLIVSYHDSGRNKRRNLLGICAECVEEVRRLVNEMPSR